MTTGPVGAGDGLTLGEGLGLAVGDGSMVGGGPPVGDGLGLVVGGGLEVGLTGRPLGLGDGLASTRVGPVFSDEQALSVTTANNPTAHADRMGAFTASPVGSA